MLKSPFSSFFLSRDFVCHNFSLKKMQVRTNLCLFVGVCYNAIKAQTVLYLFVFEISVSNHENGLLTCESFAFN